MNPDPDLVVIVILGVAFLGAAVLAGRGYSQADRWRQRAHKIAGELVGANRYADYVLARLESADNRNAQLLRDRHHDHDQAHDVIDAHWETTRTAFVETFQPAAPVDEPAPPDPIPAPVPAPALMRDAMATVEVPTIAPRDPHTFDGGDIT